jgi:hypothetical protein
LDNKESEEILSKQIVFMEGWEKPVPGCPSLWEIMMFVNGKAPPVWVERAKKLDCEHKCTVNGCEFVKLNNEK